MSFKLKPFLNSNEILFNSFGQIFFKKQFFFDFLINFVKFLPN